MITRGLQVSFTDDREIVMQVHNLRGKKDAVGIQQFEDYDIIAIPPEKLVEICIKTFGKRGWKYKCRLTLQDKQKGHELRQALKIPDDAKIVTLHVREPGYHWQMEKFYHIRNADIYSYLPALVYLMDNGYHVVRIGDRTMTPLPFTHSRIIDAPFHPLYEDFFDPCFIAESRFYIGMPSGPETLAYIFDIPMLRTNALFQWGSVGYHKGLVICLFN